MEKPRKLYTNKKWDNFSAKVKQRDGYKCLRCKRGESEVVLQVHHEIYVKDKPPWAYSLSDCRTLCKGCHARGHKLIAPDRGWTLILIEDLGGPDGICERENCGHEIRYAHVTYHPDWGYKVVGSTCVQHLTKKDRLLSGHVISLYKNISKFVHESEWVNGFTKKGKQYISAKYKYHTIRIYGEENNYSFQLVLKEKGIRWHEFRDILPARNRSLEEVKELSYIVLKGTISKDEEEKSLLRDMYRKIK
ncbi:MAG: HNH endonuclease [Gammaproteobacteria bacterium]|nr:HNH endonuclease [Gammaproteobacteria bacterium]MCW8922261.1 HNH endonuclease [Gammaproteobacteria bacterium]